MSEGVWPRYQAAGGRRARLALEFLGRWQTGLAALKLGLLVGVYLVGLFLPLPGIEPSAGVGRSWWFLDLIDKIFTGGAFGRGALFSIGTFVIPLLAAPSGGRRGFWFRAAGLTIAPLALVGVFAARGEIAVEWRAMALCFVCAAAGAVAVYWIDFQLLKLRVPDTLHLNVYLLLGSAASEAIDRAASGDSPIGVALAGLATIVILGSALYLFRDRVLIEVFNVKTAAAARYARLALRSLNETSLDGFGVLLVAFYLCLAGVFSLAFDWQRLREMPYMAGLALAVLAFLSIASAFGAFRRQLPLLSLPMVAGAGALVGPNPRLYAERMMDNYWIIEGVAAGSPTEVHLEGVTKRLWRKTLLVLLLWLAMAFGVEYYFIEFGSGAGVFPHGPLVHLFLIAMAATNVSMVLGDLRAQFGNFKHVRRGRGRVTQHAEEDAHSLRGAERVAPVELSQSGGEYFDQRLAEELEEIVQWAREARRSSARPKAERPRDRLRAAVSLFVYCVVTGVVCGAVAGFLYTLVRPAGGDVWAVVVPAFLVPVFALIASSQLVARFAAKRAKLEK